MNRRDRRAVIAAGKTAPAYLDLHCAGPHSEPAQPCSRRIAVLVPFSLEAIRHRVWQEGWFVTITSPPGSSPLTFTVLCGACADVLMPELAAEARKHMPPRGS